MAGITGCFTTPSDLDCRDAALQSLVGQPVSTLMALDPAQNFKVDRAYIDGTVTLDYFPDRVRIAVDQHEIIQAISCG